jgi:hypothetical protein
MCTVMGGVVHSVRLSYLPLISRSTNLRFLASKASPLSTRRSLLLLERFSKQLACQVPQKASSTPFVDVVTTTAL